MKILFRTAAASIAFVCLVSAQTSRTVDPAQGLVLENQHVRLEFAPSGMGLKSMTDLRTSTNHIPTVQGPLQLWELTFAGGAQRRPVTNNSKPCSYARIDRFADGRQQAVMEWNELTWWKERKALSVRVTVELPADSGIARWRILVANDSDYWGLWSVAFPAVSGFPAAGAYDVARPTFASGGQLLKKWNEPVRGRHPSGSWPMQFFSLHQGRNSVYAGTRDPDGRAKDFVAEPGKQLSVIHYPQEMTTAGSGWPDHYDVEFGVFQGGWLQAARHYRDWALHQKWARGAKLSERSDVPALIKNAAFWVCDSWLWKDPPGTQGRSTDMATWVSEYQSDQPGDPLELNQPLLAALEQMGVPTGIHWYNWHRMPFDNLYPHFLPARNGFKERVAQLVQRGVLVMPYINGVSADMNIHDWEKFAPHAILDEGGGYRMHYYLETTGRLLSMCPSQGMWRRTIAGLVDRLINEYGVNGVYVDQVSAAQHELCFNRNHGHPVGGGSYWTEGHRELMRNVRAVAGRAGRQVTITSEGADEVFLDLVDANLTWAQPTDREIPLMQVVYSGYTLFFGSPVDYRQSDRFFRYGQGQALIDGRQNGWMDLRLFAPEYARKVDYLRQCARLREKYGKYLTYGQLLEPLEPLQPIGAFTEDAFGWDKKFRGSAPVAEGRLWKAGDGRLAVFLANYVDEPVRFRFRIPDEVVKAQRPMEREEFLRPAEVRVIELP